VIWLVVCAFGLPSQILDACSDDFDSNASFSAVILYLISIYTSSIVGLVWVSIVKRKTFLKIIGNILEVDNTIQYTLQEETNMNTNVFFNIISEIIFLTVIYSTMLTYEIYQAASESFYKIVTEIIESVQDICNELILFQFINLVFMVKQRYSHLNKRLNNWINGAVSTPIVLNRERRSQYNRAVDDGNITIVSVSNIGNVVGTLKQTDIHLLRKIYSELYDISCLINDMYRFPILASMCWILTGVLCSLYDVLTAFNTFGITEVVYAIIYVVLFFQVMLFCHTATEESKSSCILVQKLLLEGNFRSECVEELKNLFLQLQVMIIEYNACGFFALNLSYFASTVGVIASYVIILVQFK
jgi:hypothetical protein